MDAKVAMRLGIVIVGMLGIGACTCSFQLKQDEPPMAPASFLPAYRSDPLGSELSRCRQLGETAAHDSNCLKTWAANRRRFLNPGEAGTSATGKPPKAALPGGN